MKISLWLPTYNSGDPDFRLMPQQAREAEQLGFDGIYLLDHLLPIEGVHTSAWLETMVGLSAIAAVTDRIPLGTASLVAGLRHPVLLAKQLASIAMIAGQRLRLGAASGWYDREYEALGYDISERGGRTTETLEALHRLLSSDDVAYHGRYWDFDEVTIQPRPAEPIPIFVGGGSRAPEAGSEYDKPEMATSVLERIATWDGWLAPCAGSEAMTYADLELVRDEIVSRRSSDEGFEYLHVQWTHIVDTGDRETALSEQLPRFRTFMGEHHTDDHFIETYLVGSRDDIEARVDRTREAGFDELIVGPVVHGREQVALLADVLLPLR